MAIIPGTIPAKAVPAFIELNAGVLPLTQSGKAWDLHVGAIPYGSAPSPTTIAVANLASGNAFNFVGALSDTGDDAIKVAYVNGPGLPGGGVEPGANAGAFVVTVDPTAVGSHTHTVLLQAFEDRQVPSVINPGTFSPLQGDDGFAGNQTLTIHYSVTAAPDLDSPMQPVLPDWNALAAEAATNFTATGHWFVGSGSPTVPLASPDWNALAADATANFAATGHWFVTPATTATDWNALAATATANFAATGHWYL